MNPTKVKQSKLLRGAAQFSQHAYKGTSLTDSEDKMTAPQNPSGTPNIQNLEERTATGRRKKPSSKNIRPTATPPASMAEMKQFFDRNNDAIDRYEEGPKVIQDCPETAQAYTDALETEIHLETKVPSEIKKRPSDRHGKSPRVSPTDDTETVNIEDLITKEAKTNRSTSDRKKKGSGKQKTQGKEETVRIPHYFNRKKQGRTYVTGDFIGSGTQGIVYEASVEGNQSFEGFEYPVKTVVLKIGNPFDGDKEDHPLNQEIQMSKHATRGLVKLLDDGLTEIKFPGHEVSVYPYAVYELLSPMDRVPGLMSFETATDIVTNLLFQLTYLHKKIVLLDIKPPNLMLRMPPKRGDTTEEAYIRKVATGQYEPVFVDIGSAKTKREIVVAGGKVNSLSISPLYLPPETAQNDIRKMKVGVGNDIYALTLSFYQLLTQQEPYQHRNPQGTEEKWSYISDPKVHPLDMDLLQQMAEDVPLYQEKFRDQFVTGFIKLFQQGTSRAAEERSDAKHYLNKFFEVFKIRDRLPNRDGTNYTYDSGKGMKWEQNIMPTKDPSIALQDTGKRERPPLFQTEKFNLGH